MKKFFWILLFLAIAAAVYSSRSIFYFRYDPSFYEHYYYHSQWYIPESTRTIADEDLYKFVGYKLVAGKNPFELNYEVPPLGKYFYGLAEKYLGNPYLLSFSYYLVSIALVFVLAGLVLKNRFQAVLSSLLFTLNPLLTNQITQTMLDLPQLVFFLLHALFVLKDFGFVAGLFLGLMAGVKIGIYTPLLILLDLFFLRSWPKKLKLVIGVGFGYVLAYFCYFIRHPNPIPWLRLHKMVLKFYLDSGVGGNPFNQLSTLMLNKYIAWWNGGKVISVADWSVLWPVGLWCLIVLVYRREKKTLYLMLCGLVFLLVNSGVPFWARYVLILLPIFSIATVAVIKNKWLFGLLVLISGVIFIKNLFPDPQLTVDRFNNFYRTRDYRNLYQMLTVRDQKIMTEPQFEDLLHSSHSTQYRKISLESENNVWRVALSWDDVIPSSSTPPAKNLIQVIPEQIGDWDKTLKAIDAVDGETMNENWRRIKLYVPDKYPVDVGMVLPSAKQADIETVSRLPGVIIN